SDDHACEDQPHPLSDHQIENIESLGAQSHAYADLSLPLGDGEGEKTIQTDDGQDQSEGGEPPKQAEIKSLRRNIIVSDFPHRPINNPGIAAKSIPPKGVTDHDD